MAIEKISRNKYSPSDSQEVLLFTEPNYEGDGYSATLGDKGKLPDKEVCSFRAGSLVKVILRGHNGASSEGGESLAIAQFGDHVGAYAFEIIAKK